MCLLCMLSFGVGFKFMFSGSNYLSGVFISIN